ncbi:transglycosylase domain-containing protein [Roseomonas elaeocarpi]|uniref:peptidoglycan glycosyltransferase n=1 Tax=Roseomonas elaeocarpi TaxID=907779 RepID=A0ABV6JWB0_9PROT
MGRAASRGELPEAPPPRAAGRARAPVGWGRWLRRGIVLSIWGSIAAAVLALSLVWDLPAPEKALAATRRPALTLEASNGQTISTSGDLYGDTLRLRDVPRFLPAALISIEDRRFRSHFGVDPVGLLRAAVTNVTSGRVVQGGSTLTQQLAKNLFLSPDRSFRRKAQEVVMALWLEHRFTKDQLLEIYLNRVYLGAGAWGVDAAARMYFGVSARNLTLWQAAMLMGLPKAPSRLNPRANPEAATRRAKEVLHAMAETGAITEEQATREGERISLPRQSARNAGWFADWAQDDLAAQFPEAGDLILRTTLDARVQALAEARLEATLHGPGEKAGVTQGAVVVLDATSGAVRAMVGGASYRESQFNRAVDARRQPGSAFKPFVVLAALENGMSIDSTVSDEPLTLGNWSPGNGHWVSRGEITVTDMLAHSINTAAVRVLLRAGGPAPAIAVAERLGLAGPFPRDATVVLGTGQASLLELVAAYAAFANGGLRVTPYALSATREGTALRPLPAPPPERAMSEDDAFAIRRALEAVVTRGTGRAAAVPGRIVGGKTGTTQDSRDAWFIGFSGRNVIGVWLGNDDGTPMDNVGGGTLPARLFHDILEALPR